MSLLMASCEKDNAEYYVKYSIKSANFMEYFSDIYYADVHGIVMCEMGHSIRQWEVTVGPVKKGFNAHVQNAVGGGNNKIEVSKNNGPFVLKASGTNSATYMIDF